MGGGGYQNQTSANKGRGGEGGGSTFWSFCDKAIIECSLKSDTKAYILYDVNSFVKTCILVNLFVFFVSRPVLFFYQKKCFN